MQNETTKTVQTVWKSTLKSEREVHVQKERKQTLWKCADDCKAATFLGGLEIQIEIKPLKWDKLCKQIELFSDFGFVWSCRRRYDYPQTKKPQKF